MSVRRYLTTKKAWDSCPSFNSMIPLILAALAKIPVQAKSVTVGIVSKPPKKRPSLASLVDCDAKTLCHIP